MIGKLVGFFNHYYCNVAIIDVFYGECSIGYEVIMKSSDIAILQKNTHVTLYIKEFIKEDDDTLYGFLSFKDKCLFEELTKLSGLGPKTALAILSAYPYESIIEAILANNCDFFSTVSGIGKKLANRIPNELSNSIIKINEKMADFGEQYDFTETNKTSKSKQSLPMQDTMVQCNQADNQKKNNQVNNQKILKKDKIDNKAIINDVVDALVALGFSKQQIYTDVFNLIRDSDNPAVENIIKEFLNKKVIK